MDWRGLESNRCGWMWEHGAPHNGDSVKAQGDKPPVLHQEALGASGQHATGGT